MSSVRDARSASEQVVQVRVVAAIARDDRPPDRAGRLEVRERFVVPLPDVEPARRDGVGLLHLRPQERGDDLAGQVRRTEVDPGVLVDLAPEELAAIRALLPDDLGALDEPRIVDQERTALAGDDVLRLVERERRHVPDAAERTVRGRSDRSPCAASSMTSRSWRAAMSMIASMSQPTPA